MSCVWPECHDDVPPGRYACGPHWKALPGHLKARLWQLEHVQSTTELGVVTHEVHAWVRAEFQGIAERHDPGRWERLVRGVRERDAARKARRELEQKEVP